jgi:hypothetical protein
MWRVKTRKLGAQTGEIRRDIGWCEQQKRKDYAQLEDIRQVQGQPRRIVRFNL